MALIRTNGGASAAGLTVVTSDRQGQSATIDITNVKYVIFGNYEGAVGYVYVYDVAAGTWNVTQSAYTVNVTGNTMSVTTTLTYYYYVTMS